MKEIKVETLSREAFYEYGSYSDLLHPEGVYLGDIPARFYRDRVTANYDPASLVAFGVNEIYPREKNALEKTEHHFNTCEVLMPMDGDIIIHVGPARKEPVYSEFRAFLIPKGTLVCLRPGVFHGGPYTAGREIVHVLLALPELMYKKDCHFYFPEAPIEIVQETDGNA